MRPPKMEAPDPYSPNILSTGLWLNHMNNNYEFFFFRKWAMLIQGREIQELFLGYSGVLRKKSVKR